jgi:glycosyltransferase involved in cell wall biosynthesis
LSSRGERLREEDVVLITDDVVRIADIDEAPQTGPSVTVVIPARNEADNLHFILPLLPREVTEVILVDGSSTDGTVEVARRLRPDVKVVHQVGTGKGNALCSGFEAATGDIIVTMDADGSADPGEIGAFVDALLDGAHFAKGTRFTEGAGSQDITRLRSAGNAVLTRLVNVLFRTHYTDLCYGYNAFWASCVTALNVDCQGFEVETLVNIRASVAGLRICEVPSFEHSRISGVSNLHAISDGLRVLRTIVWERVRTRRTRARSGVVADPNWWWDVEDAREF